MMLLKLDMFEEPMVPVAEPEGPVDPPITDQLVLFVLMLLDTLGLFVEVYEGWFECPVEEAPCWFYYDMFYEQFKLLLFVDDVCWFDPDMQAFSRDCGEIPLSLPSLGLPLFGLFG